MTVQGQIEQFPPPGLGDRFPLGYETFAGTHGNGREAPNPVARTAMIGRLKSTP